MRTGLIAEKVGMTRLFTPAGVSIPVTVLKVEECTVVGVRKQSEDGYTAVQLGAKRVAANKISVPLRGFYAKKGLEPCRVLKEFRVSDDALHEVGTTLSVSHFTDGQLVDVTGISQGKGFAGSMKRHGFGGLRATHGVSVSHRSHGSTGNRTEPGRVFKNKRMAGHMGHVQVTTLNLVVSGVDFDRNLLFIRGSVPGPKGALVFVRDAIKSGK
ncbi:MAG: 50S ribosomal protein L3 [Holosporales bacterium]|jgi:large subunit ribosomal protein L3|nr:50S ribosomal protein L3 [Holosporales bacterium]